MTDQANSKNVVKGFVLCVLYIAISAALINFNKFLMSEDRFPFSMMLTTLHMATSWICCLLLYVCVPSLFPSMSRTHGKMLTVLKYFLPLAALFSVGVVLSNQAYLYCSVAFLQFMKQANVALVFGLSCLTGSQSPDRMKLVVVCWVITGSAMAVTGEVRFMLIGFLIQAASQLGECGKNIMQEWILSGSDIKLDPLTYAIFMAPMCLIVLFVGNLFTFEARIVDRMIEWYPYLIPNALCAFTLNVTIAMPIKETSAMGFILSGVVKDMVIVIASTYLFDTSLAAQQMVGFSVATTGIFFWSYMKIAPEAHAVRLLGMLLRMPEPEKKMEETK